MVHDSRNPCGECHIQPDEVCDICGKSWSDEQLVIKCPGCMVPILTWWAPNGGGMLRGEYVLIADWVYHPKCWDETYEAGMRQIEQEHEHQPPLPTTHP